MEQATENNQAIESAPEVKQESGVVTPENKDEPKAFDPASISPEVKEYYKKQYGDYEQIKGEVTQFRQLTQDERFKKAWETINAPPTPAKFEITADDHSAALADPAKFQELVMKAAEFNSTQKFAPQLEQARREIEFAKAQSNLSQVVKEHPEFVELDKAGLIEPLLRKYPQMSFIDAMNLAKAQSGWINKQIDDKARGQVNNQKKAITERGGNSSASKGKKSFSSREKAMEYAYEEAKNGREVDPEDIEIS